MTAEDQEIIEIVRDIFNAGYKYDPADDYDLQAFLKRIKQFTNQHTLSIIEKAVEKEDDEWEFPETRGDAEMMSNRILSRVKQMVGE